MSPTKNRKCCVPHCPNSKDNCQKQFFRVTAPVKTKTSFKLVTPKSQYLNCCEDHFDLPNDAVNYIRYKYCPGTQLQLRPDQVPHRKIPLNVCRLCLNLIYYKDDIVPLYGKKGEQNCQILASQLPNIDLSMTTEPVSCLRCFNPLEQSYQIKQKCLKNEVIIVNCIKQILIKSPKRAMNSSEIDLFDEYTDIRRLVDEEKVKERMVEEERVNEVREKLSGQEEILVHIEGQSGAQKYVVEVGIEESD